MADIPVPFIGGGGDGSDECTATASDVLESKTAIYDGSDDEPAYGSMKDYSGTTSQGSSSLDESNSRLRLRVPNTGKYDTDAYLYNTYSNIRSLLGISADVIKKGVDILGITGTWEGFVPDAGDLYYQGTVGTLGGNMGVYQFDNCKASNDRSCVTLSSNGYSDLDHTSTNLAGISFSQAIDCKDYSKLTLTYNVATPPSDVGTSMNPSNNIMLCLYTSRPTTAEGFHYQNAAYYEIGDPTTSASTDNTVTLDLSGITQTLYVGAYVRGAYQNSRLEWVGEITRVSIS